MAPQLHLELAFGKRPGDSVDSSDWVDVTGSLRTTSRGGTVAEVEWGRGDELEQPDTGTASCYLDNVDRAYDPWYSGSPHAGDLLPLVPARLRATVGGTTYPLFRGYVEAWPQVGRSPGDAWVPLEIVDGRKWLGKAEVKLERPQEPTGDRVAAVLDAVGWPSGLRSLDSGVVLLDPLNGDDDENALDLVDEAAEAEQGAFYCDPEGQAVFHGRHHRLDMHDNGSMLLLGPAGYDYPEARLLWDDSHLWNAARVEQADGSVQRHEDADSVQRYGLREVPGYDYPVRPTEAEAWALWMVARYREPDLRLPQLGVAPLAGGTGTLASLLQLRLGSLVRVEREPPGGGSTISRLMHVEGVQHTVGAASWETTLELSPYYGAGPWLVLDDSERGLLDDTRKLAP